MTDLTYSIMIPAYNESERLTVSLPKMLDYVDASGLQAEIIVVNDGSTDDTAEVVRRFAGLHPDVRLVENPGNRGKGYSVRNGMLHAQGDVMLFTDADLSSPIYEAEQAICGHRSKARTSRSDRAGCRPSCRPSASPGIGNSMDACSIWHCASSWD